MTKLPLNLRALAAYAFAAWVVLLPANAGMMVSNAQIKLGIGERPAAMHGTVMNHNDEADKLIGVDSPDFERIELHTHDMDDAGLMRMRQISAYALPSHGKVTLKPGGDHLMLFGFTGKAGETVEVILRFENAAPLSVQVPTKARAKHKGHQKGHHHGHQKDH